MIVIPSELLERPYSHPVSRDLSFLALDEGSVLNGLFNEGTPGSLPGTLHLCKKARGIGPTAVGKTGDVVRIIASRRRNNCSEGESVNGSVNNVDVKGYVLRQDSWEEAPVQLIPVASELSSRSKGILETDVLADVSVFQAGGGSGGAPILVELAKCGVGGFHIMDPDRLEAANIWRHLAGLRDVGRHKTKFLAEAIHNKNPYAEVHAWEQKVSWANEALLRTIIREVDLVISAVDDPTAIVILNKICIEENKTLIIAGAFRRAHGGQILVVLPRITPCYECFRRVLPEKAMDREISSAEQANRIAYSDRPVHIEPGLSNDIAPISMMVVKLALMKLLKDKPTTLQSLDEDLIAPWYLWLNRRESGTDYEKLKPLGFDVDGMHILRWYGIELRRLPDCPCCGDYLSSLCEEEGVEIDAEDAAEFAT